MIFPIEPSEWKILSIKLTNNLTIQVVIRWQHDKNGKEDWKDIKVVKQSVIVISSLQRSVTIENILLSMINHDQTSNIINSQFYMELSFKPENSLRTTGFEPIVMTPTKKLWQHAKEQASWKGKPLKCRGQLTVSQWIICIWYLSRKTNWYIYKYIMDYI